MGLRILGPLELVAGSRSFKIGGPREHIVLATLAQKVNRITSVEQLMDAVWGDHPPSTARAQIQGCISGLRKLFGDAGMPDAIKTRSSGYLLSLADDELDSEEFAKLVSLAHRQVAEKHDADAAATLRTALALWRGPALDGIQSDPVRRNAALLEDARLEAVEERMRLDLGLGRHEEISGELRALLAEHPLRERLYGFLMLALYRAGRQVEALEVCRRARETLIAELGIEPCQELRDLERAVLNNDPSLSLPTDGDGHSDPAESPGGSPRQLPSSTADFIGRASHIDEVRRILLDEQRSAAARFAVPVIGISGRGGIGKSTLALRIAHELGEAYPDGHLYVDLQGAVGEDRTTTLLARFLRALGVSGSVIPDDQAERAEMFRSRLANKRLLLVLDDVTSEQQVIPLLPGSPSCAVIVTSRIRLGALSGAYWINLDAFDRDTSMDFLATIVGVQRLEAEPKSADELVDYCGGLPLALRIAGARLASRPHWRIAELARRLKNEVRRLDELSHHGLELRSSIGLSYRSLPDQAKRLFRLIAMIKVPDFPAWAAAALLDIELAVAEETLESLVDVQMLDMTQSPRGIRYRFHDLIRVYAQERLLATETDAERNEALGRMLGGWLALAEHAHRKEYGGDYTILHGTAPRPQVSEWLDDEFVNSPMDWLENERAALVGAIRQAAAAGLDELCWDLALTSVSLFEVKGYFDDWQETAELARQVCVETWNRTGYAAMLYSLGTLRMFQKRLDEAERHFSSALEIFESGANVHGQALVLRNAAFVDRLRGDVEPMLAKYADALVKMRLVGDVIGEANILRSLAKFRIDEGDAAEAGKMLGEAMRLCQAANYRRGEAQVASRVAELYMTTGQLALARQTLHDVLNTVREIGDRIGEAHALYGLGIVRFREGRLDMAEATLVLTLAIAEEIGDRLIEGQVQYALGELDVARADNPAAAEHLARARSLFGDLGSSLWLAKTLILLAEVHHTGGDQDVEQAASLLRRIDSKEATRLLEQLQSTIVPDGDSLSGRIPRQTRFGSESSSVVPPQ
ncbi:DNA-binding SARP family transcriptional activator [Allocatelliglobosispora scoriae]|uniref:DNA-binding SARP family transcriptional activator n=1 Tax=Allocatelliglobosispora scoriae TaxID=643052 RepID=A0A841C2D9_9ACTN|nr:AfsR/SARP family transcriptional regulator [Allocatelliglobosispora scoriae]MBB5873469.1 DNA-binding SARP family transcriptional activator [Allocatelliglobosispora scoriae]